jgi:hypothetical protein
MLSKIEPIGIFWGVGKYTPNAAILGDMGWKPIFVKQWGAVTRQFCRFFKDA